MGTHGGEVKKVSSGTMGCFLLLFFLTVFFTYLHDGHKEGIDVVGLLPIPPHTLHIHDSSFFLLFVIRAACFVSPSLLASCTFRGTGGRKKFDTGVSVFIRYPGG